MNRLFNQNLDSSNFEYFNKIKESLLDPQAKKISNDLTWIKLSNEFINQKYPVVSLGNGKPILLLHGFDSCFLEFRRIYPLLKNDFKLIIPDLYGFGFSPRLKTIKNNPDRIISTLLNLIDQIDLGGKLNIIGASMGGSVALSLSNKLLDNVEKLLLLSPAGLFGTPKSIPRPFNQIGASFLGSQFVRKSLCRQAFANPNKSVGKMEEQIASIHLGCPGWRNSLASFAESGGFAGTYKEIKDIPIKTICGEQDRILGKREMGKLRMINKLNLLSLKNCGHLPHLDLPFLTGKIIVDFFK